MLSYTAGRSIKDVQKLHAPQIINKTVQLLKHQVVLNTVSDMT